MTPVEAIILAGGFGTRLKGVIDDMPKTMALINEKPFLEYLLDYLGNFGIEHVILSVGYKWEQISRHFGDRYGSIKLSYAVESEPLGTGGGIRLAMEKTMGDHVFILNGDTFFRVNLHDLAEFYLAHNADLCLSVKRMRDFYRYGTIELDVCKVVNFREKKPVSSGLINGGVYVTSASLFDRFDLPSIFSFETDFLEKQLEALKICAMHSSEYFIDIGVPADYEKAKSELPLLVSK
ncbi:MAG: nucleotidyltransferase family protein [Bacteroidales bacterium]